MPPVSAKWDSNESLYPKGNEVIFRTYCRRNKGQQEKAFSMLQSRKIVSVKSLQENKNLYVKAMVKVSHGTEVRPEVILFELN